MDRRDFDVPSALGAAALLAGQQRGAEASPSTHSPSMATRKILIAGGNYNTSFIRYMAELTGKKRPKILYLPTASADSPTGIVNFFMACSTLDVEPQVQTSFIESLSQKRGWDEVLLSVDGIV